MARARLLAFPLALVLVLLSSARHGGGYGVHKGQHLKRRSLQEEAPHTKAAALLSPTNGTANGTYKGEWTWHQRLNASPPDHFLQRSSGLIVFRLRSSGALREDMQHVRGELVLRDGVYVTESDVRMSFSGVFMPSRGKLIAVAEETGDSERSGGEGAVPSGDPPSNPALRLAAEELLQGLRGGEDPAGAEVRAGAILEGVEAAKAGCKYSLQLTFAPNSSEPAGDGGEFMPPVTATGSLSSSGCGVALSIAAGAADTERYQAKAVHYATMMTFVALTQVALTLKQLEAVASSAAAARVSLLCVGQQALLDAYLCLLHLTLGIMVESLFNAFATAAFVEFCCFGIFGMRLLLTSWRARHGSGLDHWSLQRSMSILYARFYAALLTGIMLSYHLQNHMWVMVMVLYTFWVPQIARCAYEGCPQPLLPAYVVGTSLVRLALPLYVYGCPANLLHAQPRPGMCVAVVAFVGAQVAVLLLQQSWGPRWFIPKRFLPAKYDYFRQFTPRGKGPGGEGPKDIETGDAGGEDCVICMNVVHSGEAHMVAPCDHTFHRHCLERWMTVKMECPTCRRALPVP